LQCPIDAPQRAFGWASCKVEIPHVFSALFEEENYTLRTGQQRFANDRLSDQIVLVLRCDVQQGQSFNQQEHADDKGD
jgi:hypothetical protein